MTMFKAALLDKECWINNIKLGEDGLDPEGAKMRAAQGLDAGDYFVTGYWVWAKIIENFAAVGYDNNNMHLAAYDWRLSYENLEKRDRYFSKLKSTIENSYIYENQKAVVLTHSMGSLVFYYFLQWVENENGGKGGKEWTEKYIDSIVNIGGAMLGALKTIPSYISGEQREFVQPMSAFVLNRFLTKRERVEILKTWQGMASLIPKGGSKVWGKVDSNANFIQKINDDLRVSSRGSVISMNNGTHRIEYDMDKSIDLLFDVTGEEFKKKVHSLYSYGFASKKEDIDPQNKKQWSNPLESQLPNAPSLKIYCLYGYGNPTERTYYYTHNNEYNTSDLGSKLNDVKYYIQSSLENTELNITDGVRTDEGDGSVQLISLGYMCVEGWKKTLFNPSNISIVTREYMHQPVPIYEDIRGGMDSSDHVDILGNHGVTKDVLKIATGVGLSTLVDMIESDIVEISKKVTFE